MLKTEFDWLKMHALKSNGIFVQKRSILCTYKKSM